MIKAVAETWWSALSKREQNRRKEELSKELELRGMDIPNSDYGWDNAAYEAEYA